MRRSAPSGSGPGQDPTDNDGGGLDALYRRYSHWLKRVVGRRIGRSDPAGVDDAVQEAYVRIAPYLARGEVQRPRALLMRIAINVVHDQHRRAARYQTAPLLIEDLDEKTEHAHAADQLETVLLQQVVLSLPPNLRDVFVLSRYAAMSNQQIAERCDLSVKTVEERMTKALKHLAHQLRD
jgi:RNA polymerase sigma-70 factor (ECF subfamily)